MRVILKSDKWISKRTLADLVIIGNDKFWFSNRELLAAEINGTYRVRGSWPSGSHANQLPRNSYNDRFDWFWFNIDVSLHFWKLFTAPFNPYAENPIRIERFAGDRMNAFAFIVGGLKLYFSQGEFMAYEWNNGGVIVSENTFHDGTITRHMNALVDKTHPRINRVEFLQTFERTVPDFGARSRMVWLA